jgi:anti-sigma regulatory factor (Ser/Thr protein kinase)
MSDSTGAHMPQAPASAAFVGTVGTAHRIGSHAAPSPPASSPPVPPSRHRAIICGQWPHQDAIEFGPLPGAVPCARLHARHVLWEWGQSRLTASAELLVSELMTNAITASRSAGQLSPVWLWLLADRTRVLVLVWDACPRPPVPADLSHDAETGRGLLLVQAISQQWDWYYPQQADGKVVWALMQAELQ